MELTRDQALADAERALRDAFPDRWERVLRALAAPPIDIAVVFDEMGCPYIRARGGDPEQRISLKWGTNPVPILSAEVGELQMLERVVGHAPPLELSPRPRRRARRRRRESLVTPVVVGTVAGVVGAALANLPLAGLPPKKRDP